MKKTDKISAFFGITFALLLGGAILAYNKLVNASVESAEIKEAEIIQSLCMENIGISVYDRITQKHHLMFKNVSVNKYIAIDSNHNSIQDDDDIVFESRFSSNLPWNSRVSYFDTIPFELKKGLKDITEMPKYIIEGNTLYVYSPKEGSNMLYLKHKFGAVPLAVKNQNGTYDILHLPSNMYGKKAKKLDENLYNIIEMKQNLR